MTRKEIKRLAIFAIVAGLVVMVLSGGFAKVSDLAAFICFGVGFGLAGVGYLKLIQVSIK